MRQDDKDRARRADDWASAARRRKEAVKKSAAGYFGMTERAQQPSLAWGLTTVCPWELVSEQAFVL